MGAITVQLRPLPMIDFPQILIEIGLTLGAHQADPFAWRNKYEDIKYTCNDGDDDSRIRIG